MQRRSEREYSGLHARLVLSSFRRFISPWNSFQTAGQMFVFLDNRCIYARFFSWTPSGGVTRLWEDHRRPLCRPQHAFLQKYETQNKTFNQKLCSSLKANPRPSSSGSQIPSLLWSLQISSSWKEKTKHLLSIVFQKLLRSQRDEHLKLCSFLFLLTSSSTLL